MPFDIEESLIFRQSVVEISPDCLKSSSFRSAEQKPNYGLARDKLNQPAAFGSSEENLDSGFVQLRIKRPTIGVMLCNVRTRDALLLKL